MLWSCLKVLTHFNPPTYIAYIPKSQIMQRIHKILAFLPLSRLWNETLKCNMFGLLNTKITTFNSLQKVNPLEIPLLVFFQQIFSLNGKKFRIYGCSLHIENCFKKSHITPIIENKPLINCYSHKLVDISF